MSDRGSRNEIKNVIHKHTDRERERERPKEEKKRVVNRNMITEDCYQAKAHSHTTSALNVYKVGFVLYAIDIIKTRRNKQTRPRNRFYFLVIEVKNMKKKKSTKGEEDGEKN